ncbi:MAG TPA: hypothetical protein VGD65_03555 [Chryseosolibacter sp.]
MTREVFAWIVKASVISPLIPLILLFFYRNAQPKQNLILGVSILLSLVFDVTAWTLAQEQISNNLIINLYFIFAFPAIMWFYHETLIKRSLKVLTRIFTIAFLVVAVIFAVNEGMDTLSFKTWMVSSILITVTSFFFVADLNLMDASSFLNNPYHKTNIFINTSLALYYFITTVMFAVSDYVFAHSTREGGFAFWACHNMLNVMKNIGLAVAFYMSAKASIRRGQENLHHNV